MASPARCWSDRWPNPASTVSGHPPRGHTLLLFLKRLANAYDRCDLERQERRHLAGDVLVGLAEQTTSLRVANDAIGGAALFQHGSADLAGVRASLFPIAVLSPNPHSRGREIDAQRFQIHEGRAEHDVRARSQCLRGCPKRRQNRGPAPAPCSFSSWRRRAVACSRAGLAPQRSDAGQFFALKVFQRCATAGRDVRHLLCKAVACARLLQYLRRQRWK